MLTQKLYEFLINANSTNRKERNKNENKMKTAKRSITFYFRIKGQDRR